MNVPISGRLKLIFLIHAIVGLVLGLGMVFIPTTLGDWFRIPMEGTFVERFVGVAIISLGLSSFLAYMQTRFESIKLLVQLELIWTLLATILFAWGAITIDEYPAIVPDQIDTARIWVWVFAIIMGLFFFAFGSCYLLDEKSAPSQTYAGSEA